VNSARLPRVHTDNEQKKTLKA